MHEKIYLYHLIINIIIIMIIIIIIIITLILLIIIIIIIICINFVSQKRSLNLLVIINYWYSSPISMDISFYLTFLVFITF